MATPSTQVEIEHEDFIPRFNRYLRFFGSVRTGSLQYKPEGFGVGVVRSREELRYGWLHVMLTDAARAAGYRCGEDHMLKTAIRKAVAIPMGDLTFTDSLYDRFLEDYIYDRVVGDTAIRNVVLMCPAVNAIDMSALESLEEINQRLGDVSDGNDCDRQYDKN